MPPHLDNRDKPPPHPPLRRVSNLCFFSQNTIGALSKKGKSIVGAPSSGRQRVNVGGPGMKGKGAFDAPSMKDKGTDLPI